MTIDAHDEVLKTGAIPDLLYSREKELDTDEVEMLLCVSISNTVTYLFLLLPLFRMSETCSSCSCDDLL